MNLEREYFTRYQQTFLLLLIAAYKIAGTIHSSNRNDAGSRVRTSSKYNACFEFTAPVEKGSLHDGDCWWQIYWQNYTDRIMILVQIS